MLGIVAVVVAVSVAVWAFARARPERSPREPPEAEVTGIDPGDLAEHASHRDAVLQAHLQPLVQRRVPVRSIEPVPELQTVRVRFADGTAVVVRGEVAGDAGVLASVLRDHSVLPAACSTDAGGTRIVFDWSGGRRHLAMRVAGLDQPD